EDGTAADGMAVAHAAASRTRARPMNLRMSGAMMAQDIPGWSWTHATPRTCPDVAVDRAAGAEPAGASPRRHAGHRAGGRPLPRRRRRPDAGTGRDHPRRWQSRYLAFERDR